MGNFSRLFEDAFEEHYIYEDAESDGIIGHDEYTSEHEKKGLIKSKGIEYVVENPNQVKSATDNIATFSTENDDIQMAVDDNLKNNSNFVSQSDLDSTISSIVKAAESGKWDSESLQQLDNILKEINNGRIEYKRYPGRVHEAYRRMAGGRTAGAWLLFTRDDRTMEEKSRTLTPAERYTKEEADRPGQERALKAWAKATDLWFEDASEPVKGMEHKKDLDGGEAKIYVKDAHTYRKLIHNDYFITPQLMLDRIAIHNALSPAKLILQGFTQDKNGNVVFVVDQKIVRGTAPTDADVEKLTTILKLKMHPKFRGNTFLTEDGSLYISDLHDENIIVNPKGDPIIIDTEARLNTPELGEEGTYIPNNELVLQKSDTQTITNKQSKDDIPFYLLKTPKGEVEVYGFIDPETHDMYLDDAVINPEHPIHEYTHLWDKAMLKTNKDLWNQGVTLMKQLKLWKEIENSEQYGQKWKTMSTLPTFCTPIPLSDMKQDFFTFVDLSFPNFIYICTF